LNLTRFQFGNCVRNEIFDGLLVSVYDALGTGLVVQYSKNLFRILKIN
jgi:hypothetical protein